MAASYATKNRQDPVAAAFTVLLVPAFVVSQWVAVRWGIPLRAVFNVAVLGAAAYVAIRHRSRLRPYRRELVIVGLVTFGVVASAALHYDSVAVTAFGVLPYLGVVAVTLGALAAPLEHDDLSRSVTVVMITIGVMAVVAVLQLVIGRPAYVASFQDLAYPRWWERGRATGLVANPGRLGQLGVFAVALAPLSRSRGVMFAALAALVVAASGSRLAVVISVAALMAWPVLRSQTARRSLLVAGVGVVAALALIQLTIPEARDNFWSRTATVIEEATDPDGESRDIRVENLRAGIEAWKASPILGWGPGRFGSTTAWRYGSDLHDRFDLPDVRSEAVAASALLQDGSEIDEGIAQLDLGWLQVATELGVVGLVGFVALLGSLAWRAWRSRAVTSLLLIGSLAVLTVASPGLVDLSLAAVFLWWAGVTLTTAEVAEAV